MALGIDGYLSVQRELDYLVADMRDDCFALGRTTRGPVVDAWLVDGQRRALKLIEDANQADPEIRIRWVWLDASAEAPFQPGLSRAALDPVLRGEEASFRQRDDGGGEDLFVYVPVVLQHLGRPGALELSESLSELNSYAYGTIVRTIVLTMALVVLGFLVIFLFGMKMVGRPLRQLGEKVRRTAAGDFSDPIQHWTHDELGELALALNGMCAQLEQGRERIRLETEARVAAVEQLRHADRLTTVGRLSSGIAHELGTPLNVISGRAGMIARDSLLATETRESARIIKEQTERITGIIRRLLDFARHRPVEKTPVDLRELVHQVVELMLPIGRKQRVEFCLTSSSETAAKVKADGEQIQQVLMNLISNALQAMPDGGTVEVGIRQANARPPAGHEGSEGEHICLWIRDSGHGISQEDIVHVFDPFFTTKDVGQGTGLGLSIAHGIVREHGGWIEVESEVDKGSCFSVYLPQENC